MDFTKSINDAVRKELAENKIPEDAKFAVVAGVNNEGIKVLGLVKIVDHKKFEVEFGGSLEHEWDGDNIGQASVIFIGK